MNNYKYRGNFSGSNQAIYQKFNRMDNRKNQAFRQKKCFICHKVGFWSTKHSPEECRNATLEAFHNFFLCNAKDMNDGPKVKK